VRRRVLLVASLLLVSGGSTAQTGNLRLGTTTHFSQGWPDRFWPLVAQAAAVTIRDSIHWRRVEVTRGSYSFNATNSGHIQRACNAGVGVVLGLDPRHPLYDNGNTAFTPLSRLAYANYVKAIADRFGNCIIAVEVGNEINGSGNVVGPAAMDRATSHTALLRDVYRIAKPGHAGLAILGGSTNAIGTGFLIDLFNAGALAFMDGVAIHPYRQEPTNVDWEIDRLTSAMAAQGTPKPIWATEFSRDFPSPAEAPGFIVKMVTLMSSAGVRDAQWYALADQQGFPTMGLFAFDGSRKPVADSFRHLAADILPHGPAVRLNTAEPALFHYRYGTDRQIIWGAHRAFSLSGSATIRNASGVLIPQPAEIGDNPILVEGVTTIRLGPQTVLADSLYDYGKPIWEYFATRSNGSSINLRPIDWRFSSYIGHPALKPIVVNPLGMAPAGGGRVPIKVVLRHTLAAGGLFYASACITRKTRSGDGVSFELRRNGTPITQGVASALPYRVNVPVAAGTGDRLEFVVGPNATSAGDQVNYRFRVSKSQSDQAQCS
jgi:hypothetical protein